MGTNVDLNQFSDFLAKRTSTIGLHLEVAIKRCGEKIRSDIQYNMSHTPLDMSKSYYTNNETKAHHPSLPENPPAPDTGNLRESIRYEVHKEGKEVYGIVGSSQMDENYAVYTEYGTTKMAPRPWLKPAMENNADFIKKTISKAVKNTLTGEGEAE